MNAIGNAAGPDAMLTGQRDQDWDLGELLHAARAHLGMDIAFIGRFAEGRRIFTHVDAAGASPIAPGMSDPLEDSYCQRIVDGRLPQLMRDPALVPEAAALPVTKDLPVGAHLSLPITLGDGTIHGTFCCFSFTPDTTLNARDLQVLRVFADLAARRIDRQLFASRERERRAAAIQGVLDRAELGVVFQPIHDLRRDRIVGVECLSRFTASPQRGPDFWFAEASAVGLGDALEAAALGHAVAALDALPRGIDLNINASPAAVLSGALAAVLEGRDLRRIVLEVTEHEAIADYEAFSAALAPLRARGLRLAVDDAGAGYASFRHILHLRPDIIKLDISLTRGIDADPGRRALAGALIGFASETRRSIIAEGVETPSELDQLRALGAHTAQGYLLGRPMRLPDLLPLLN